MRKITNAEWQRGFIFNARSRKNRIDLCETYGLSLDEHRYLTQRGHITRIKLYYESPTANAWEHGDFDDFVAEAYTGFLGQNRFSIVTGDGPEDAILNLAKDVLAGGWDACTQRTEDALHKLLTDPNTDVEIQKTLADAEIQSIMKDW